MHLVCSSCGEKYQKQRPDYVVGLLMINFREIAIFDVAEGATEGDVCEAAFCKANELYGDFDSVDVFTFDRHNGPELIPEDDPFPDDPVCDLDDMPAQEDEIPF